MTRKKPEKRSAEKTVRDIPRAPRRQAKVGCESLAYEKGKK